MSSVQLSGKGDGCGIASSSEHDIVADILENTCSNICDDPVESYQVGDGKQNTRTRKPSRWMKFSLELRNFVNRNYRRYLEDFVQKEVKSDIDDKRNNDGDAGLGGLIGTQNEIHEDCSCSKTDHVNKSLGTEQDLVQESSETKSKIANGVCKDSVSSDIFEVIETRSRRCPSFLSSAAYTWTSEDNLVINKGTVDEDEVQPGVCFCWPIVNLVYRIRYRLFDQRTDRRERSPTKIIKID